MPVGGSNKSGQQSDEDDDFFKPGTNSTLANVFGLSKSVPPTKQASKDLTKPNKSSTGKLSDRYGASSFRYVPPQEVIESDDENASAKPSVEWSLVQASVVTAYRLVDGENISQGRLGLALLRSCSEFRILLYRTKTDALATLNVSNSTKLFLQNSYLQFRSDDECFWSVLFEKDSEFRRLLATLDGVCLLSGDKTQTEQVPASRSIPVVEEPDSDVDRSKANLISRMARMGQSIFPQEKKSFTSEISDSSDTDARIETIPRSTFPPHHRRVGSNSKILPVTIGMQMIPTATTLPGSVAGQSMLQTASDVNFNLFMTESRMQGTEMRMNLSKLESKLDRMLDKIDILNLQGPTGMGEKSGTDRDGDILALEEKILGLRKENHALKGIIRNLEQKMSDHNENDSARENLARADEQCQELKERIELLKRDVQANHNKNIENQRVIEEQDEKLKANREIINDKTKEICSLEERLKDIEGKNNSLLEKNASLIEQVESMEKSAKTMEQELTKYKMDKVDNSSFDDVVKEIMNNCYQRLYEQIDDTKTIKMIGHTIRQETKAALGRQKKK